MAESRRSLRDTLDGIEQQKRVVQQQYRNDPAQLERYMRVDYGPMVERYTKLLEDSDVPYRAAIAVVDRQLEEPEAALAQRTIVKQDPRDPLAYVFVDAADPMALVPMKPNPAYFRKAPRHFVHMVAATLTWDHEDPIAAKFHDDLLEAIDLGKLAAMVGTGMCQGSCPIHHSLRGGCERHRSREVADGVEDHVADRGPVARRSRPAARVGGLGGGVDRRALREDPDVAALVA